MARAIIEVRPKAFSLRISSPISDKQAKRQAISMSMDDGYTIRCMRSLRAFRNILQIDRAAVACRLSPLGFCRWRAGDSASRESGRSDCPRQRLERARGSGRKWLDILHCRKIPRCQVSHEREAFLPLFLLPRIDRLRRIFRESPHCGARVGTDPWNRNFQFSSHTSRTPQPEFPAGQLSAFVHPLQTEVADPAA